MANPAFLQSQLPLLYRLAITGNTVLVEQLLLPIGEEGDPAITLAAQVVDGSLARLLIVDIHPARL